MIYFLKVLQIRKIYGNIYKMFVLNHAQPTSPTYGQFNSVLFVFCLLQFGWPEITDPRSMPPPPGPGPRTTVRTPHKKTKITIRDLTYRLFCFVFCYCCLLHCGDERRTCVPRKRPTASAIMFGSFPRLFIDSSQASQNSAPSTKRDTDVHYR